MTLLPQTAESSSPFHLPQQFHLSNKHENFPPHFTEHRSFTFIEKAPKLKFLGLCSREELEATRQDRGLAAAKVCTLVCLHGSRAFLGLGGPLGRSTLAPIPGKGWWGSAAVEKQRSSSSHTLRSLSFPPKLHPTLCLRSRKPLGCLRGPQLQLPHPRA